jgi:hypothetical protein
MRTITALLAISGILLLASCQKEVNFNSRDNNGNNPSQVTGDFKAKIDGSQWVANKVAGASRMGGLINVTGISTDKRIITMTLQDNGVGSYTLNDQAMHAGALLDSNETNPIAFASNQSSDPALAGGTVNITAIDATNKKISGNFSFKVFRALDNKGHTITEGTFSNITYVTTLPPASTTDTFRVKIAGTPWTPATITGINVTLPQLSSLSITASDATGSKSIGLTMPPAITPGTYTLDFFGMTYTGLYNPDSDPNHSQGSTSGTLTILEHNTSTKRIRGNFNFHAESIANPAINSAITEGYFSVKYQ